jgi:leucyl-tRNA synthetase
LHLTSLRSFWERAGHATTIANEQWPEADATALAASIGTVTVIVQVGDRKRDEITVPVSASDEEIELSAIARLRESGRVGVPSRPVRRVVRDNENGLPRLINFAENKS